MLKRKPTYLCEDVLAPPVQDEHVPDVQYDVLAKDPRECLADPVAEVDPKAAKVLAVLGPARKNKFWCL